MKLYFFFFQAEDGIRDIGVTGVQTWLFRSAPLVDPVQLVGEVRLQVRQGPPGVVQLGVQRAQLPQRRAAQAGGERERGAWGESGDIGGRRVIKKKKHNKVIATCTS